MEEELSQYSDFWKQKILCNIERDKRVNKELKELGWTVLRYWESDIKKNIDKVIDDILKHLA